MRRTGGLIAALVMLAATPVVAQQGTQHGAPQRDAAFSPEEDLDCAIYIGALMAESEVEMTPESRIALTSTFTYFIGRYEAQRGVPLAQAMGERYAVYTERNPQELEQLCSLRARGFAVRLQDVGRVMAELAPGETPNEPGTAGEPAGE